MVVRLRVKEVAKEKGVGIGKLQRSADVAYNTVKRMFKDPYYITTTETLGKIARALGVLTTESGMAIANRALDLWRDGYYTPGLAYPHTLEETLLEIQEGPKAKGNYEAWFQPFTPANGDRQRGIGEVAGGIVKHPETNLWQIWLMVDGPCTFIAAYRDPVNAQSNLEAIISASRKGGTDAEIAALYFYRQVQSKVDGEPKQLPYEMMLYLI